MSALDLDVYATVRALSGGGAKGLASGATALRGFEHFRRDRGEAEDPCAGFEDPLRAQRALDIACCRYAVWRGEDRTGSIGGPTLRSYVSTVFRAFVVLHGLPGGQSKRLRSLLSYFATHMARAAALGGPVASKAASGRKHPADLHRLAVWFTARPRGL